MEDKLVLWARYQPAFVKQKIIPEIFENIKNDGMLWPEAYQVYKDNISKENCMLFHHSYTEQNIPMGKIYSHIAWIEDGVILPASIQECHAKAVCFLTAYKTQPSDHAMCGHHELSLIEFQKVPSMIYDLQEISKNKTLRNGKYLCLF